MVHTPEFQDKTTDKTTSDLLKAFDLETPTPATKSEVEKVGELLKKQLDGHVSHEETELYKKQPTDEKAVHKLETLVSKDNPKAKEVYEKATSPKMLYVDKAIPGHEVSHESTLLPKEQYEGKPQNLEGANPKVEQTEKPSDKTQVSDKANEKHEKIADNVKTNDKGQIAEIAYPDGTSRHFEYGQDGKMTGYTAPEGSHWTTKDGVTWTKDGGKDQICGVFSTNKETGEFAFLNAVEGHATVCTADGKRVEKGDILPEINKFISAHKGSIDTLNTGSFFKKQVEDQINNPKSSAEDTIAAAFLRKTMKAADESAFASSPEQLKQALSELKPEDLKSWFKEIATGVALSQNLDQQKVFPDTDQDLAETIKWAKPGDLGNEATLQPLKDLASKEGGLAQIRNMVKDNNDGTYTVTFPGDSENPVKVEAPTLGETVLSSSGPADSSGQNSKFLAIYEKAAGTYLNEHQATNDQIAHTMQHLITDGKLDAKTVIPADGLSYDPNGETVSALLGLTPKVEVARKTPPLKKQPTQISYDDTNSKKDKPSIG